MCRPFCCSCTEADIEHLDELKSITSKSDYMYIDAADRKIAKPKSLGAQFALLDCFKWVCILLQI